MKPPTSNLLSKINEIRLLYIETNNKLCDSVEEIAYSFISQHNKLQPSISIQVKEYVEKELNKIRERSVNSIGMGFYRYFDLVENFCKRSSVLAPKRFSKAITNILEQSFKSNQYPSDLEKSTLSEICNLTTKQITNWFTNKRNRYKNSNKKYFSYT